jgi:hypothetical protein
MTMNTRVHIAQPIHAEGLFKHIMTILESDPSFGRTATWREVRKGEPIIRADGAPMCHAITGEPFTYNESGFSTTPGQGIACIWEVEYGSDGPMHSHLVSANFDTAYSYRSANGAGCSDLHAFLLREIKAYLDDQGVTEWVWMHEEKGSWHLPNEYPLRGDADLAAAHFNTQSGRQP